MRTVKFDIETYNRTKASGTPVCTHVDEEYGEIGTAVDHDGNPTLGGRIGYALAYLLMAGCVGYFVLFV